MADEQGVEPAAPNRRQPTATANTRCVVDTPAGGNDNGTPTDHDDGVQMSDDEVVYTDQMHFNGEVVPKIMTLTGIV